MKKRRPIDLTLSGDPSFELDLAPMLALMVNLIPMLLITTVFVRNMIIETPIPTVVQEAIKKDQQDPKVSITLKASRLNGFEIDIDQSGAHQKMSIGLSQNQLNYEELHRHVVKVKQQFPDTFSLQFEPESDLSYKEIVQILDEVRSRKMGDPKLFIVDQTTNQNVEVDLLFPKVEFSNIFEEG